MADRLDIDSCHLRVELIRHAPHGSQLLGRSPEPTDGRWQRGDIVRGLYLAVTSDTAVAEWYRTLAELGLPPGRAIPHDHHFWRVDLQLADLSTPEKLDRAGLGMPRPSRRTWPPYQEVGEQVWRAGWRGLLTLSAARPDSLIVCIFDAGSWPPEGCGPIRRLEVTEVPAPPTGMTT
jgi:hypothetical protein